MKIKPGVALADLQPPMAIAAFVVHTVCVAFGVECVITSGLDGVHSEGSLHYKGLGLDFRTRDLPRKVQPSFRDAVAEALGPEFDVVLEKDHLHVEHEPR